MPSWLGQLVISKASRSDKSRFKVQYWRTPSMTPASISFDNVEDLRRYLRHCRLSSMTPDEVIEQLQTEPRITLTTFESEEAVG